MDLNKRYIIDLSQAKTPADIVFELSNIIEKEEAANQHIWLKLGDITLNQSQLLSINSLINSINSKLSLIESQSQQTELAAATLGICTKDVEEEIKNELEENTPEAPLNTENETPSEQYIPMTDHIDNDTENKEENYTEDSRDEIETKTETEANVSDNKDNLDINTEVKEESDKTPQASDSENTQSDELQSITDTTISSSEEENIQTGEFDESNEPSNIPPDEEIQEQLDSIFDSETKLENILSEEQDLTKMQNWPLTKEASEDEDFEIPEEVMTDEDYEILQMNTQYHKQTVRSGQVIKSNGNVVIIGDCHPGCEIHAAGDITVWGILGGIAHAGCNGNTKARIRALNLNAIQLRIADSYARRPDHIKNIYVEKTNTYTPEEARNINGSIVILKINDK